MDNEITRRRFYLSQDVMDFIDDQARKARVSPSVYVEGLVRDRGQHSCSLKEVSVEK